MRSVVLSAAVTALALSLTGHAGGATEHAEEPATAATPVRTVARPSPPPVRTDGEDVTVPAGREVAVRWGHHDVDEVSMTPDRAVRLWDFLVGHDRGLVLAWPDGTEFGYLYPVGGTLPSGDIAEVRSAADVAEVGAQLTDHDLFPDLYVRPIGATVVQAFRHTLVLDVTTRAAASRDPRPVLRVAPTDGLSGLEAVGVGPARGATERSWIVDVDGRPWALTVDADADDALAAAEELVASLRFDTDDARAWERGAADGGDQPDVPQP